MIISSRLKKIEKELNVNSNYCACGTPYFVSIAPNEKITTNDFCPECAKRVRPQTIAEIAEQYETEVLRPQLD